MLERLKSSLESCPIVRRGEYNYFIHPITDGVPLLDPCLLREVACAMVSVMDLRGVDKIVTAEAMGIHIGTALSLVTDIPLNIIRKRQYSLPGEVAVHQSTGYSSGQLYLNGIEKGDRVVVIDDVISTGGTLKAVLAALESAGAEIADICIVIRRGNPSLDRPFTTLVTIDVDEHGVHVTDSCR
ncbi:MAG: hypoxanthine/guanine phosphoribosyltransferase [Methanofollis sp.]|uniref:hypoxanthine/guanine phosphoribosyltransferase n=1 Tax=Methanofollis sp. TaxID=2052835 RepID=UPI0026058A6B|nr:hypoxanthine/guanine phosphoribosyltransferase [Methanofollis sp.]MDD4255766.1 hypoxanthine/guanine phosphoribosyltransferase [Methanofollis sp.]